MGASHCFRGLFLLACLIVASASGQETQLQLPDAPGAWLNSSPISQKVASGFKGGIRKPRQGRQHVATGVSPWNSVAAHAKAPTGVTAISISVRLPATIATCLITGWPGRFNRCCDLLATNLRRPIVGGGRALCLRLTAGPLALHDF